MCVIDIGRMEHWYISFLVLISKQHYDTVKRICFLDSTSTPATLEQNYIVCELHQKISVLFSFLRSHLKKKSIVFFSSCKEVSTPEFFLLNVFVLDHRL